MLQTPDPKNHYLKNNDFKFQSREFQEFQSIFANIINSPYLARMKRSVDDVGNIITLDKTWKVILLNLREPRFLWIATWAGSSIATPPSTPLSFCQSEPLERCLCRSPPFTCVCSRHCWQMELCSPYCWGLAYLCFCEEEAQGLSFSFYMTET